MSVYTSVANGKYFVDRECIAILLTFLWLCPRKPCQRYFVIDLFDLTIQIREPVDVNWDFLAAAVSTLLFCTFFNRIAASEQDIVAAGRY